MLGKTDRSDSECLTKEVGLRKVKVTFMKLIQGPSCWGG